MFSPDGPEEGIRWMRPSRARGLANFPAKEFQRAEHVRRREGAAAVDSIHAVLTVPYLVSRIHRTHFCVRWDAPWRSTSSSRKRER